MGNAVYCCEECRKQGQLARNRERKPKHLIGPCPTCGEMFRSRIKDKTFCSMKCYTTNPETLDRLRAMNDERKVPVTSCPQCGEDTATGRKYCSNLCRRRYFAERFDRFVANPEQIALPQNFDEFLLQSSLPCLFDGCEWSGPNLAVHVNFAHGISADDFKELVGFNKTTGLVCPELSRELSAKAKRLIAEGVLVSDPSHLESADRSRKGLRLEGKEHWQKSMALGGGHKRFVEAAVAKSREPERRKEMGERVKQTIAEMPTVALTCQECGVSFETKEMHAKRAKFCSQKCRNDCNNRKRRSST